MRDPDVECDVGRPGFCWGGEERLPGGIHAQHRQVSLRRHPITLPEAQTEGPLTGAKLATQRGHGDAPAGVRAQVSPGLRRLWATELTRAILRNYHDERSGDIYAGFESHRFINEFDGLRIAAPRVAPCRYETRAPVMFTGGKLTAQALARPVTPYDITPTFTCYLGIRSPDAAVGVSPLELLGQ